MNRPTATFHGMNPQQRDNKLSMLRMDPRGSLPLPDPTLVGRPQGNSYRKEEKNPATEFVGTESPQNGVRLRMEPNNRDAMNSRILEGSQFTAARNMTSGDKPIIQDMNPVSSRRTVASYKQAIEFFPDVEPVITSTGVQPRTAPAIAPPRFMDNPYLQRQDAIGEPRQIIRELKSAVSEDNRELYLHNSQKLAERNFSHFWIPPAEEKEQKNSNLQAYELLKPKLDDFSTDYRKFTYK
jgi:hypothetical protein